MDSIPVDEKKVVLTEVAKKLEGHQYQIGIAIKHECMQFSMLFYPLGESVVIILK